MYVPTVLDAIECDVDGRLTRGGWQGRPLALPSYQFTLEIHDRWAASALLVLLADQPGSNSHGCTKGADVEEGGGG